MVDMLEQTVVSTIGPGGPCDVSGPVAVVAGDVLVVSSECRDIYRGTLEQTVISTIGLRGPCDVSGPVADAPGDVLVVSAGSRDIDRGTLEQTVISTFTREAPVMCPGRWRMSPVMC